MNPNVDLKQLAVNREPLLPALAPRRHLVTRYLLPGAVLTIRFGWPKLG